MIVKKDFELLKNIPNVLSMSSAAIKRAEIENGPRHIFVLLELQKNRIGHFTKDRIFRLLSGLKAREQLHVVLLPNYSLPNTYNTKTDGIIINLSPFGVDQVDASKPGIMNLYALLVYGITFSDVVSGKVKVTDRYSTPIANLFVSLVIRLFGKQYGLLGSFSTEIPKLKFLTNCYILQSFFGLTKLPMYKRAATASGFDYRPYVEKLNKFDFSSINEYIRSLSDFDVLPNINRHIFAGKFLNQFKFNFLPALEDLSRFVATIATSNIKGSSVIPTYLEKYNTRDYASILEISKTVFKRK